MQRNNLAKMTILLVACVIVLFLFIGNETDSARTITIDQGEFSAWSSLSGTLESRNPSLIASSLRSSARIIFLASDGTDVHAGDILARIDTSTQEKELRQLSLELAEAESKLSALRDASAPLETRQLAHDLEDAEERLAGEQRYRDRMTELLAQDIVNEDDIFRQDRVIAALQDETDTHRLKMRLARELLQPAALRDAKLRRDWLASQVSIAAGEVENGVLRAVSDGTVAYRQLYLGTEWRTVRIGDIIQPNQPFMSVAAMEDLIVLCEVPEAELASLHVGARSYVLPIAFPGLRLPASVESVSTVAMTSAGRPAWEKYFQVVIRPTTKDERLKPGLSVTAQILTAYNPSAVLVPRSAVTWREGQAWVTVAGNPDNERHISIAAANDQYFDADGVAPGEHLVLP